MGALPYHLSTASLVSNISFELYFTAELQLWTETTSSLATKTTHSSSKRNSGFLGWKLYMYFHGTNVKMFVNFHVISSSFQTETKLKLQRTLWPFLWLDNASNSVHWFDPANPDGKGCVFLFCVIGQVVVGYSCNWLRSECHSSVNGFEWGFRIILTFG